MRGFFDLLGLGDRLGPGVFVTWVTTFVDEKGEPVGRQTFRILKFRPDLEAYTREDVTSLLTAVWNGGKSGFDAVLRTRANSPKRAGSLSWVKE